MLMPFVRKNGYKPVSTTDLRTQYRAVESVEPVCFCVHTCIYPSIYSFSLSVILSVFLCVCILLFAVAVQWKPSIFVGQAGVGSGCLVGPSGG